MRACVHASSRLAGLTNVFCKLFVNYWSDGPLMDYKPNAYVCMHAWTNCVVWKGVPTSRVKGRARLWVDDARYFVTSWSDGLQTHGTFHAYKADCFERAWTMGGVDVAMWLFLLNLGVMECGLMLCLLLNLGVMDYKPKACECMHHHW